MITAIVVLSVWAILATITAVDNENRRSKLYDEREELQEECEKQEREYKKLEAEYAELKEESEEHSKNYQAEVTECICYKWLLDVCANQGKENYDADKALELILRTEHSWLNSDLVDEEVIAAVVKIHKESALVILSRYDLDLGIE